MDKSRPTSELASPTPRLPAPRRTGLVAAFALAALVNIAIGSGITLLAGGARAPAVASQGEAAPGTTAGTDNG